MRVIFRDEGGAAETVVEAPAGVSLMSVAVSQGVHGIEGACGGSMVCGTCHVYVDEPWRDRVGPPGSEEGVLLDCSLDPRANSRLACQIRLVEGLDGLIVTTPASQL